jgi:hypothetical protein
VNDDNDIEKRRQWNRGGYDAPAGPRAPSEWDRNLSKRTHADDEHDAERGNDGDPNAGIAPNPFDVWGEGLAAPLGAASGRNHAAVKQADVGGRQDRPHESRGTALKRPRADVFDVWTQGIATAPDSTASQLAQRPGNAAGGGAAMAPVQRKAIGAAVMDPDSVTEAAAQGTQGASAPLPYLAEIQRAFGRHDVSNVRAQVGGHAATAAAALGARAYAHGNTVAFAQAPDLHTAAHEAAHIVQQRAGIAPAGLDGGASDSLERQADAVADAVVAGRNAEHLLGAKTSNAGVSSAVQRQSVPGAAAAVADPETKYTFRFARGTTFKIAGIPAKLTGNFDYDLKDKGSLNVGGKKAKAAALSTQRMIENSADGLDAKIKASLAKGSVDLLSAGQLPAPLSDLPLTVKVEVSGLDASISLKKVDLKLMSIGVTIEGEFTAWLPKDLQGAFRHQSQPPS